MKSLSILGSLAVCAASLMAPSANAAPYSSHVIFTPEVAPHEHVHLNWSMGCSLFPQTPSVIDSSGSWGFPFCSVYAPNGAGIYDYGIDFRVISLAHVSGTTATTPQSQNYDNWWPYTGAELNGTGGTILHHNFASGRILHDSLQVIYNFWYRITPTGIKYNVFGNNPTQTDRYGTP